MPTVRQCARLAYRQRSRETKTSGGDEKLSTRLDGESKLMIWIIALALFMLWLTGLLLGKGGFLHVILLSAVAIAFVQWVAERRAAQG